MERVIYIIIIAGLCFLLFRMNTCNQAATIVKTDTSYRTVHDTVSHDVPAPYAVKGETVYVPMAGKPIYIDRPAVVDTGAILAAYFSKAYYSDTALVKYGRIFIRDTVTQNRIAGRSILTDFQIPIVSTTVTRTAPPKGMLFGGVDIGFGVGAGLDWKTKSDHLYGASYMLTQHGGILDLRARWKISFH